MQKGKNVDEVVTTTKTTDEGSEIAIFEGNRPVRTYSKEVHGKEYKELAEQYLKQYPQYRTEVK